LNERIKQFADEAAKYSAIMALPTGESGDKLFVEKFAELIVQECLRQVQEQYKPVLEDAVMMKDTHWDGYVQCGVDSYVAIREHFYGVEE
jgi:hypothetical protein